MTQLFAFLILYAFAGSAVKWLLDYRVKDKWGDSVGEGLRRHFFGVVYIMAPVFWPITTIILLSVYGGKLTVLSRARKESGQNRPRISRL